MMWSNGMGWGGWLLMSLTTVAFWALIIFGIVAVFGGGWRTAGRRRDDTAEQILAERFARGEISEEEYRSRKSILQAGR
jgi:putative membrane protein